MVTKVERKVEMDYGEIKAQFWLGPKVFGTKWVFSSESPVKWRTFNDHPLTKEVEPEAYAGRKI